MLTWLIVVLAIPVYIWAWRLSFRWFTSKESKIDGNTFLLGLLIATLACWVFAPIALIEEGAQRIKPHLTWATWARSLGGESRSDRKERRTREHAEFERQLDKALDE